MKIIELYEIPIYLMDESKYMNKVKEGIFKRAETFIQHGHTEERAIEIARKCSLNKPWRFNLIIGYLIVSVSKHDMWFDLYYTNDTRIPYNSGRRNIIVNQMLGGYHFQITSDMKNDKILHEMNNFLSSIKKKQIRKNHFLDDHVIMNTMYYIDIRKIIDSI